MRGHVLAVSSLALTLPFFALADTLPVNQIVAFGDSLTDTGNASIATLGSQPPAGYAFRSIPGVPFQVGEFTNPPAPGGPSGLWIDQFAAKAGLPDPQPFLPPVGGTNYAIASAQTGSNPTLHDGVSDQLNFYLGGSSSAPSTNLYSFWAGANDISQAVTHGENPVTAAETAAANLDRNIATLAGDGGKYFLWFNLPLLGNLPAGASESAALNAASSAFDTEWRNDIQNLDAEFKDKGIVVVGVDVETLAANIASNPGKYGFTGLVEPKGDALNGYVVSFDGFHPTSDTDQFIADLALADFEAAVQPPSTVPEPTSATLVLLGVSTLLAIVTKRVFTSAPPFRR